MPYFVYYVTINPATNTKKLEYIETHDTFKAARNMARDKRAEIRDAENLRDCRMIFAKNQVEAEKLLSAPREERVIGED